MTYPNLSMILNPWVIPQWKTYVPSFQSTSDDASLGDGTLTGSYIKQGKSCRVMLCLVWGNTSNAGSGYIRFPMPPGIVPDLDKWTIYAGNPILPATGSGVVPGAPIAFSANIAYVLGEYVTIAPIDSMIPGNFACIYADIPIK